jgi:hypothetical protein
MLSFTLFVIGKIIITPTPAEGELKTRRQI